MKTIFTLFCALALFATGAFPQTNTLTSTTASSAILATDSIINVTSATGLIAPSVGVAGWQLYVVAPGTTKGETMVIRSISSTAITVSRGRTGVRSAFPSGSLVLAGAANWFYAYDPMAGCTAASTYVTPWVNTLTGSQWLCSTITLSWVPGFQNDSNPAQPTTAVASAAGLITPSGKLQHITGTSAITGFNIPVGFVADTICAIPDAIWTTTTANNIALASTSVVSKQLCWRYDSVAGKFYPSY